MTKTTEVSLDDLINEAAAGGPAPHVNQFSIQSFPEGFRIAFIEQLPGQKPVFRSGAVFGRELASQLVTVLSRLAEAPPPPAKPN